LCKQVVSGGKLKASLKPETSDIYLIVVPTPFKGTNHDPDISFVESATLAIIPYLKEGDLFIIESTSPVGTQKKWNNLFFSNV
jgi:UDP-N-acetyl-D-mannosaminuronic acid dehydrogenase